MSLLALMLAGLGYGALSLVRSRRPVPRATALLAGGDPQAAQLLLRPLVKSEPRNAEAHVLLGRTQLDLSDAVAAEKEFKIARALRYDRSVVNPLLAQAYLLQGHYRELLADIQGTAAGQDELVSNLVVRGTAYVLLGDVVQAQASLDEAARLAPENIEVLLGQVRLLEARGSVRAALEEVERVLAGAPSNLAALMLKGELLSKAGDLEGAIAAMNKAVADAPFSIPARIQRANQLIALGNDKAAQEDVDAAFHVNWHDNSVYLTNAILMMRAGKFGDAAVEFQKLAPFMDDFPKAYYYQAVTAARQNQNESALEIIRRYLKIEPRDGDAIRLGAELELKLERPERAISLLTGAKRAGVWDGAASDLLGRAYFAQGRMAEAIQSYKEASGLEPDNKEFAAHLQAVEKLAGISPGAAGASERGAGDGPR